MERESREIDSPDFAREASGLSIDAVFKQIRADFDKLFKIKGLKGCRWIVHLPSKEWAIGTTVQNARETLQRKLGILEIPYRRKDFRWKTI